ncbi:DUF2157 domain-containing protein [Mangrovivirga sp. M17]|uniref:DUF2157 domain-containing protein n=1 Tax=Mangrovivirga halotolerans TaxID=2993936 RepID=A0ABT3RU98_9BACT|nr:DUF2157 domain-containing protein [Mangrovivirga halotolerans]MCX2745355.1 DUF2157 domain-containing protein [Mangrovivirga halotolerans]
MNITKDLKELTEKGVISDDIAENIRSYYASKKQPESNKLVLAFSILGSLLIGSGIILIIAHNWDQFSRLTRTVIAFLPLVLGQLACGFAILKKKDSQSWKEGSAVFLFLSIGATISLISQIYHIQGQLSGFLLTWVLLGLPIIYLMRSSISSLFYIIGITWYACELSYWNYPSTTAYGYWLLLAAVIPWYLYLLRSKPESNFTYFHHWFLPLSVTICLGSLSGKFEELMFIVYISYFGLIYLVGNGFNDLKLRNNGFKIFGALGTMVVLYSLSFDEFWNHLRSERFDIDGISTSPEAIASLILFGIASVFLTLKIKSKGIKNVSFLSLVFPLVGLTFIIGLRAPMAVFLINISILTIGILYVNEGAKKDHLGIMNFGMVTIALLAICRFFDSDLSFYVRGALFVIVGISFFVANYWMLKRKSKNEK